MKRFFYMFGAFLFATAILVACSYSLNTQIKKNISEESRVLFSADTESFFVTLTSGVREHPYLQDGISQSKIDFAVLTITFYENNTEVLINVELIINQEHFTQILERNDYNSNYMTDLEKQVDETASIILIYNSQEISLACASAEFEIDYEQAIEIALETLHEDLVERFENTSFDAECYLKILNNPTQNKNVFFWYFSIKDNQGTIGTVVIDTMSQTVLAKY